MTGENRSVERLLISLVLTVHYAWLGVKVNEILSSDTKGTICLEFLIWFLFLSIVVVIFI